jgi:hypothetical protein
MFSRLFIALLLSTLEQLIVGTALTSISSDLGQYDKSIWVVTAYLMTYNGLYDLVWLFLL